MRGFIYFTTTLFFITSCGGSGSKPLPTVNLTATPTSVVLGNTSTFSWTSTNANSCSASWTIQTSTFGTELLIINNLGNNTYSITCNGDGGISSASVTVEGYRETDGVVVDGYISGAEVFIDEDDDWLLDSNENSTTSDNEGKFTIRYANGNLVSIGGTDLDSQTLLDNLLITHKLIGHSDFKAVTPVTSVAAFMEDTSLVNAALGIDSSIDVFTFDPVANKGDGGINDYLYEKGNQLTVLAFALQNITNNLNTTTETTQDYFKAITEEIEKEYTETSTKVDIETEAFVTKVFDNVITAKSVTIDETAKANTAKALAGVMPIIEVKSSDDLTTGVIRFAVSTLQTDIQAIANGTATAETVTSYTEDILAYIAEDQNIDADEITPDISAIADSAITSEDAAVTINVVANDSYVTNAPVTVTATNGTNGTTTIAESSPEQITYDPDADYNGTDTFSYIITQGDKTSSADVTVTIEPVNDEPSIDVASTIKVDENQTAVTTVSVSDVDRDDLTLTLGGTDADSFNLSDENVLTFKEAPDYETKNSYSITLTLTDGIETVTKDLTIAITNVNDIAPEFTSDATFSAAENQTAIGTVTATDADGDGIVYSISGSDITINSSTGFITFTTAPDYETKTTYTAIVTASDGANSATQDITVNVNNVNDIAPVFTSANNFSVVEGQTAIGTVTATDAEGDDVTFTVSGTELTITSGGVLTFVSAPDYETKSSYTATVTASDGVNTSNQNITIDVTFNYEYPDHWDQHQANLNKIKDVYTNPIGFNLDKVWFTTFNINKDKFSTTRFDYFLEDPYFQGNVGVNTWFTEGDATYYFNCNWVPQVPSEGATKIFKYVNGEFNKLIYQKNEGCNHPFSIKNKDGSFQHIFLGLDEGKLGTGSQALGDTYTFNTQSGEFTNLNFSIGSHGQHVFDYQQDGDEDIISNDFGNIVASGNPFILRNDGENNFSVVMVPQPDFIETGRLRYATMSAAAFYESGYLKVVYTDFDVSKELDNRWGIEAEKNVIVTYEPNNLTVVDVTQLPDPYSEENFVNLEYYNQSWIGSNGLSHDVRSTPIDIDYDGDIDIVIGSQVYGENISLPQILINNNGVFEDQTESRLFNWVFATGSIHRWDFADVNGDGYLDIITKDGCNNLLESSDGELIAIRPNGCELKVAVNDGTGHFISIIEPTHILQIFEGNEFKTGRILPIFGMDQNRNLSWVYADGKECNGCYNEGNHEIFTVKLDGILSTGPNGMDPAIRGEPGFNEFYYLLHHADARDAVSSGQYDNGLEHYIAVGKDLGYSPNAKSSTNVTVDSYSINPVHTVKSKYVNLVPSITSSATFSAAENQTAIGTVTATDAEGDDVSFTISGDELAITSAGVLTFVSAPDYETKTSYTATVTASDGVNSTTQNITVNVTNVNDIAPEFTSNATFSAAENQTAIGTVTATDAEGDDVSFTISGDELAITSAGVLTFVSAPDYETKTSYTATVTASDGTNTETQAITVNVTNVNDIAPEFTSNATFSAAENQTAIGTVTATDADGDGITYSISGSDITINSSSGVIAFASAPDYETKTSYTATVTASDGINSTTEDVSINTTNIDEGIISWDYYISDGTDNSPPILNSTIQFDASMDIDDAIVTLRQDVNIGGHGFKKIQHTETDTNKWVGTFIFPENANPNISYYGTIFYKEGDNSTNFNGLSSAAITGNSKWTEIITSYNALKLGLTDETTSIFKTFNNESFDSVAPAVQGYIDNQGNLVSNPEDALIISGNDGDVTTPINISLTVQYDEDILYAMVNMYLRTEGGLYTEYRDAETTINKNKVTINLSLNSKTPIDGSNDLRLYIYGYDSGLNRTRTRTGYMDLESNSIGDTNVPTLSSIDFSASLKNDGRKLIDYQYVFSAEDNDLIEIGQTLKGPYCNFVYLRSHDYNIDPTLASGTYSGSKLLAKNMPDGIYITQRALNVHDSQYNKLLINRSDLSNYSLDPIKFGESSDYCPDFKEDRYSDIEIPENISTSTAVTTFKDEIKDPYGNFISPEFSLGGLDGQLFNISSEGDITFKTVPDYENSLDSDNNSRYEIDVRVHSTAYPVSENPNLYISEGITIEVTNVKEWPSSAQVDFIDDTYSYGWVDFIPANFYLAKIIAITSDIPYTKVIISGQDADYFNFQNGTKEGTETNDLNFLIYRNNDNYECGRSFSFRITLTDGTNSVYDDAIIPLTCS